MANVKKGNLTAPPQWWTHFKKERSLLDGVIFSTYN
jgi:hypothetical protein